MVIQRPSAAEPQSLMARVLSQTTKSPTTHQDKVQAFLTAGIPFKLGAIDKKFTPLWWWKANSSTYLASFQMAYPALSQMAHAYLGAFGSSFTIKCLLLAATGVCTSNCGCLLFSTMSHCVSSLIWLWEDVPLTWNALKMLLPLPKK
jgi:hypothetical protein